MRQFKNGNHFMKHILIDSIKVNQPTRIFIPFVRKKTDYIHHLNKILEQQNPFWTINLFENTWLYLKGDYSNLTHKSYDNKTKARRNILQRLSDVNFDIDQISNFNNNGFNQTKQKMNSQKQLLLGVLHSPNISFRSFPLRTYR